MHPSSIFSYRCNKLPLALVIIIFGLLACKPIGVAPAYWRPRLRGCPIDLTLVEVDQSEIDGNSMELATCQFVEYMYLIKDAEGKKYIFGSHENESKWRAFKKHMRQSDMVFLWTNKTKTKGGVLIQASKWPEIGKIRKTLQFIVCSEGNTI